MDFHYYDDKELIYLIKENNQRALELFIKKYNIITLKIIRSFHFPTIDHEDILADSYDLLLKCIKTYNRGTFYTYYSVCLKRDLIKRLRKPDNMLLRLEDNYIDSTDYENRYLSRSQVIEIYNKGNALQKQITHYILKGYKVKDISKELNLPINKVYYEMRKLAKKRQVITS